ncbi:hypothetical protein DM992_34665 [Burkholderia sp. JP2-270]|nr:hypothetical protein DM992_34665 [Burkholderia sp. JP2-270]
MCSRLATRSACSREPGGRLAIIFSRAEMAMPSRPSSLAGPGGRPDLSLSVPLPALTYVASQSRMSTTTMINRIDGG